MYTINLYNVVLQLDCNRAGKFLKIKLFWKKRYKYSRNIQLVCKSNGKFYCVLTLGIRAACNQAGVMLFKWHHFVGFQLVHTIGGFMMTGTWVKPISRGYQNGVALRNQSTIPSLLIIEFRCSFQELINRVACGGLCLRCWSLVIFHFLCFLL